MDLLTDVLSVQLFDVYRLLGTFLLQVIRI